MFGLTLVTCVMGLAICLNGERSQRFLQRAFGKTLASLSFVAAGLACHLLETPHGRAAMVALALGLLGDLALLSDRRPIFLAGLIAFLFGHLAYAVALVMLGTSLVGLGLGALLITAITTPVGLWAGAGAGRLAPALHAYVVVIGAMVALAIGVAALSPTLPHLALAVAAVIFAASDVFVARQRFITAEFTNRAIGLPLYYAAQMMLVWGLAGS